RHVLFSGSPSLPSTCFSSGNMGYAIGWEPWTACKSWFSFAKRFGRRRANSIGRWRNCWESYHDHFAHAAPTGAAHGLLAGDDQAGRQPEQRAVVHVPAGGAAARHARRLRRHAAPVSAVLPRGPGIATHQGRSSFAPR